MLFSQFCIPISIDYLIIRKLTIVRVYFSAKCSSHWFSCHQLTHTILRSPRENSRSLSGFLGEVVDPVTSRALPWAPLIHFGLRGRAAHWLRDRVAAARCIQVHPCLTSYKEARTTGKLTGLGQHAGRDCWQKQLLRC